MMVRFDYDILVDLLDDDVIMSAVCGVINCEECCIASRCDAYQEYMAAVKSGL